MTDSIETSEGEALPYTPPVKVEVLDQLGNPLAIGDTVATAMTSRYAGNVRTGTVASIGTKGVVVKMDSTGQSVGRRFDQVVKAVRG